MVNRDSFQSIRYYFIKFSVKGLAMQNKFSQIIKLSIVSFIIVIFTGCPSVALTVNCDRTTSNHGAFAKKAHFEGWFVKKMSFNTNRLVKETKSMENGKGYWRTKGTRVYITTNRKALGGVPVRIISRLLPSKLMITGFQKYGNFKHVDGVRYKCDKGAADVIRALKGGSTTSSSTSSSSSSSSSSSTNSKLNKAKSLCTELGFKSGTEKHGDCVMKLLDN